MTPQEQEMIDGLVDRIRKTQVTNKDSAAEQRLQQGLAGYPDAVYVLAQTVLVQQYGLGQAQAQINDLKAQSEDLKAQNDTLQDQLQQAAQAKNTGGGGGSFLSHIFGGGSSSQPSAPPAPPYQPVNNPGYGAQPYPGGYPPPPAGYSPQGYPAQSPGMFGGGGGGGFLQSAIQTAAGVAAGEMMFQGMESLFHGFEHGGGGYGSGFSGMGERGGETVVNNYYDDDRGGREDRGRDEGGRGDSSFYNPSDDASRSDMGDSSARFADTGSDLSNDEPLAGGSDDSTFDDSGSDDSSGFDDNSGSDDGGSY